MTQIELFGENYAVKYTMATACLYQRTTGRNALDLGAEFGSGDVEHTLTLFYSMLLTANPNKELPTLDKILDDITWEKSQEIMSVTAKEIQAFFAPSAKKHQEDSDEEQQKNV